MTLNVRKRVLLYAFLLTSIIILTSVVFSFIILLSKQYQLDSAQKEMLHQNQILAVFLFVGSCILFFLYKKSVSPEMFFYIIFIFSLSLELLKIFQLYFYTNNFPLFPGLLTSKIIYGGRVFSLFSLFAASLFCTGFETRRMLTLFVTYLFLSVLFGMNILLLTKKINQFFIYTLGYKKEIYFLYILIAVFCIINYIFGTIKTRSIDFGILGLASLLAAGGIILLYFPVTLLIYSIGLGLITLGTVLFSTRIHSIYLWS